MAEPEDKQCRPLLKSTSDLVVLSFEVAGKEAERLPARISEALRSEDVQKAIKAALDKEAQKLIEAQESGKAADPKQGEAVLTNLGEAAFNAVSADVRKQIEHAPQVKRLQKDAKQVLEDFKCSPVGVWVNENQTFIYIVGAVLALGGGAALYYTKSGDFVAKFVEGKGKTIQLGKIEISGKLTKFQPSTRTVGASVGLSGKWKALNADFTLSGTAVGSQGTVSADGKIVIPLTESLTAMTSARFDLGALPGSNEPRLRLLPAQPQTGWNQYHYRVAAGLSFKNDVLTWDLLGVVDNSKPSGSLKATYQHTFTDWRLQTGVGVEAGPGNFSGRATVGLASRRKDLPLEINTQAEVNSQGVYRVQTNLVFRFK